MITNNQKQTLGEYRVGTKFNPSELSIVDIIKQRNAELIDLYETLKNGNGEVARLVALAQTKTEEAAMWAVKAATKKPKED